jgi:hypothetical protein
MCANIKKEVNIKKSAKSMMSANKEMIDISLRK